MSSIEDIRNKFSIPKLNPPGIPTENIELDAYRDPTLPRIIIGKYKPQTLLPLLSYVVTEVKNVDFKYTKFTRLEVPNELIDELSNAPWTLHFKIIRNIEEKVGSALDEICCDILKQYFNSANQEQGAYDDIIIAPKDLYDDMLANCFNRKPVDNMTPRYYGCLLYYSPLVKMAYIVHNKIESKIELEIEKTKDPDKGLYNYLIAVEVSVGKARESNGKEIIL